MKHTPVLGNCCIEFRLSCDIFKQWSIYLATKELILFCQVFVLIWHFSLKKETLFPLNLPLPPALPVLFHSSVRFASVYSGHSIVFRND